MPPKTEVKKYDVTVKTTTKKVNDCTQVKKVTTICSKDKDKPNTSCNPCNGTTS
jgi:hypothetical protein